MNQTSTPTPSDVIAGWFTTPEFSHAATREDAANDLLALLDSAGYYVAKKPKRSFYLSFAERNAAIRAYNSHARETLSRGEMIDAIVDAINEERVAWSKK